MILPLSEPLDAQCYGGKAARLSVCLRAGLPVPPGVALAAQLVDQMARSVLASDQQIMLEQHLAGLGEARLAVRSSAIGEDGAVASFAGQHDTHLNVRGLENVYKAVTAVWASGQTESARRYRARLGIEGLPQVAVLIQKLVPADIAGVLFTCDPLGGARDRWVVEASWGLGEAVVDGLVTPDHYTIAPSGTLLACQAGYKDRVILPDEWGGTCERTVEDFARVQQTCLDEETLARLAELGKACEQLFGPDQDIEWALAGEQLFLLQCRPITTGGRA
jgi:pyruvate,water dikinase